MNQPTIIIVHRLNNRIRVKLSHPLRGVEEVIVAMEKREGVESFSYNNITKSIVI
ncbi:hypothetical protein G8T67_12030, partial [Clostridium botulinum C/D]|nr:hypothetical protein [Clostridium botulinum C/D]